MSFENIFKDKKVLVTGHTGFKGSWLSLWLNSLGAFVYGFSNDIPSQPSHFEIAKINELLQDKRLDILDYKNLKEEINNIKPDFIFHLAAQALVSESYQNPIKTFQVNTLGTGNILETMRTYNKKCIVVLITSDKCYLNKEWIWGYKETDVLGGIDPYSASKASAEILINSYIKSYFPKDGQVKIGIGRAGNVIGGGDWAKNRIVPDCMQASANNLPVELRRPNSTRPWQHVLEPLSGYLALSEALFKDNKYHGEAFNFGPSGIHTATVGDLVKRMSFYWRNVQWKNISGDLSNVHEAGLLKLNCDKAYDCLGWVSRWDIDKTIKETVLWYKEFYTNGNKNIRELSLKQIENYQKVIK